MLSLPILLVTVRIHKFQQLFTKNCESVTNFRICSSNYQWLLHQAQFSERRPDGDGF